MPDALGGRPTAPYPNPASAFRFFCVNAHLIDHIAMIPQSLFLVPFKLNALFYGLPKVEYII